MAKNEAKIKFTAETGEFNKAIKNANDEMGELRAELKLNESQMKTTGVTVEALGKKHELLESQLKTSQDKTEALSQKVQKAAEIFGENSTEVTKLKTQLANAQAAEEKIKQAIANCNTEIEEQARAASEAESATAQLTDKIDKQQGEVEQLKKEYVEAALQYGENSKEAKNLAKKITDLSGDLKDNQSELAKASKKADELDQSFDNAGDAAANSEGGFTIAKGAIADLASNAIQAAIGKIKEFTGHLMELPEATRELRQDMATLETSFDTAGFTTEEATNTWKELYKIFGEDDRAVEAANLISKMSDNQEDLSSWVTITKGIWGSYQDSLPVEGLAEASNETAKVGKVTGVLADALNWSSEAAAMFAGYMSEDVTTAEDAFNEALAECTTEQERQTLITETLTALYGDAAQKYDEASGAQTEAKAATADNILVQNQLADTMEPLTTAWQGMKTELTSGVMPAVEKFSEWGMNAIGWMQEHPVLMKTLGAVLGVVAAALTALTIVVLAYTVAQWAMNAAVLANPITWIIVGIIAAIAAVVAIVMIVIEYWDQIVAAVQNALAAVGQFFSDLWAKIQEIWAAVSGFFVGIATWIYDNVIAPVAQFFVDLWNGIVNAFHTVIDPWVEIIKRAAALLYDNVIKPIADFFVGLWDGIVDGVKTAIDTVKDVFFTVKNWINEKIIQPITGFFSSLWNGFKDGASKAWDGIKSIFSKVADFFGGIFNTVKDKILGAFAVGGKIFSGIKDGIINVFKTVVNAIIKGLNKVISVPLEGLNGILDKIYNISILGVKPFEWLTWRIPIPQIPLLANGGIVDRPTLNIAGEAGTEAIIPIDKLQHYVSGAVERSMQALNIGALAAAVEDLANRPIELAINGRQFALATAGDNDRVNGMRNRIIERGVLLD